MEKKHKVALISIIILLVILLGFMQYVKNKEIAEKFNMFQLGYNDGTILDISQFVIECTPYNVEVFNLINLKKEHKGIMFRCLKDNISKTMEFSGLYGKYKEVK